MIIREERPKDYTKIAVLHYLAFQNSFSQEESVLVSLLRQEKGYTPRLSLVMEVDGDIIGHVMVTQYTFKIKNKAIKGGILAPLGVKPEWQGRGVGSQLMVSVHREAKKLGVSLIALLGHDSYYPQFGYETNLFGETHIDMSLPLNKEGVGTSLITRKPLIEDINTLQELWVKTNYDVPLAIAPDDSLHAWVSTNKDIRSIVYISDGEMVGYTRIHEKTKEIKFFLAKDKKVAKDVLSKVIESHQIQKSVVLPLHPVRIDWFIEEMISAKATSWPAGMICFLENDIEFNVYKSGVKEDKKNLGIIHWPVPFEAI